MSKINNTKICVVGWHFFKKMYKPLSKCKFDVHVVAHRYNKILDDLDFDYSVTKNVGLEFGAYDYYIKNIWDKKSDVIFMHDDGELKKISAIDNIVDKCRRFDIGYILGGTCNVKRKTSTRCVYLSFAAIDLLLKKFGGIGFEAKDRGYTLRTKDIYDSELTSSYRDKFDIARDFKVSMDVLTKKYKLSKTMFTCKDVIFYVRGKMRYKSDDIFLTDNTVFGRRDTNPLEVIAESYDTDIGRSKHFYTKWYDFCLSAIRLDNLNVLKVGGGKESLLLWRSYFENSTVQGISSKKVTCEMLDSICDDIHLGVDIIIDDGTLSVGSRVEVFKLLFQRLNPAGIYVAENLQNSYASNGGLLSFFKNLVDDVNYHGKASYNNFERVVQEQLSGISGYERLITAIHFYPGIAFIFKRFCK